MKYLISIILLAFTLNANALDSRTVGSAGFNNLTPQQQAEIISSVTAKAAENRPSAPVMAKATDITNEWLNIGARIGQGFAGAAKELGIAANDFAASPVGKWVAFLIIWHFMGAMAVHIGFSLMFLTVAMGSIYWYTRATRENKITYDVDKTDIFGRSRISEFRRGEMPEETRAIVIIGALITGVATIAIMFTGW